MIRLLIFAAIVAVSATVGNVTGHPYIGLIIFITGMLRVFR